MDEASLQARDSVMLLSKSNVSPSHTMTKFRDKPKKVGEVVLSVVIDTAVKSLSAGC